MKSLSIKSLLCALVAATFLATVCVAQDAAVRFDVRGDDAPARAFFESLVDGTSTNMLVHPDVKGRISVTLKHVTIAETLEAVRDLYGYDYRPTSGGYMILPAAVQTRVFHLNYLDV